MSLWEGVTELRGLQKQVVGVGICYGKDGAGDRIRTGDINLGKVALYQLSYSRLPDFLILASDPPVVNLMQSSCLNHNPVTLFFILS